MLVFIFGLFFSMTDTTNSTLQQCISINFLTYSVGNLYSSRAATKAVGGSRLVVVEGSQLVAVVFGKQLVLVIK